MSGSGSENEVSRGELTAMGWKQGSLFSLPSAYLLSNMADDQDPAVTAIEPVAAPLDNDDLLIVINQDCDIEAHGDREPYVEAIVCRKTSSIEILRASRRNSARWFLIDPQENLVAYAIDRLTLDKRILRMISPQQWPGSEDYLNRFRRWLARRYDRPAIPDHIVTTFHKPMDKCMNRLEKKASNDFKAFNRVVSEMRIHIPSDDAPPYPIDILLVTDCRGISAEEANAVDSVMTQIKQTLKDDEAILKPWRILHLEEITAAEYLVTRPLLYDYLTHQGEELLGATSRSSP